MGPPGSEIVEPARLEDAGPAANCRRALESESSAADREANLEDAGHFSGSAASGCEQGFEATARAREPALGSTARVAARTEASGAALEPDGLQPDNMAGSMLDAGAEVVTDVHTREDGGLVVKEPGLGAPGRVLEAGEEQPAAEQAASVEVSDDDAVDVEHDDGEGKDADALPALLDAGEAVDEEDEEALFAAAVEREKRSAPAGAPKAGCHCARTPALQRGENFWRGAQRGPLGWLLQGAHTCASATFTRSRPSRARTKL